MADNNINTGERGGSATTVLISVIIVVIIGAALYLGFVRGNEGDNSPENVIDINATVPAGAPGGGIAE